MSSVMSLMVSDGSIAATCEVTEAASVTDQVNEIGWSSASGSSCAGTSEVIWNGMFRAPPNAASSPADAASAPLQEPVSVLVCGAAEVGDPAENANTVATSAAATATRVPRAVMILDNMQPSRPSIGVACSPQTELSGEVPNGSDRPPRRTATSRTTHVCGD